jgi:arginyl-tRNA synthetase
MIIIEIKKIIQLCCEELGYPYPEGVLISEPPADFPADLAVNIAFQLAGLAKKSPLEIAKQFQIKLEEQGIIGKVEIAGPGFLNLKMKDSFLQEVQNNLRLPSFAPKKEKIIVEFLSANPTGPLHIGNSRGGPLGETIARTLEKVGYPVDREYYVNDIGGQANLFAESVLFYYLQYYHQPATFPEKGYPGEYVKEVGEKIAQLKGKIFLDFSYESRVEAIRPVAIQMILDEIKETSQKIGIRFDRWYYQSELEERGLSQAVLGLLEEREATLKRDGAEWLKNGIVANDRETVLVKSDGTYTYFLDDIAYHNEKLVERGFARAVVVLGANHSGHPERIRAALSALGIDPERYQAVVYQYVQLKRNGQTMRMAKREGNIITADEVLEEVPVEVFNYFMLSKGNETHLDFDLQLAKDTSEKNPVYYIQYAYARIASLNRLMLEKGESGNEEMKENLTEPLSEAERRLILWLDLYAERVEEVSHTYQVQILANYALELATRFHFLYAHQRIITEDKLKTRHLYQLSKYTGEVLKDVLNLLAIEVKEKMLRESKF